MNWQRNLRAMLAATLLLGAWPITPTATAATPDLTLVTDTTYVVRPDEARIEVVVDVTASSNKGETKTSMYYFNRALLVVQDGAVAPSVSGLKGAKVKVAKRDDKSTTLQISFGDRLYGGSTARFRLTFSLPDAGSSNISHVRVGRSLVTFPVWAYATAATPGSSAAVEFPAGYEVTVETGSFAETGATATGGTRLATGPLDNPLGFFAFVTGQQPPEWTDTTLSVPVPDGTVELVMRAWSDDPRWAGRVGNTLAKTLPILRADLGFTWPHTDPVVVQEAVSRTGGGHAGRYDSSGRVIEVAYWAADEAVIHEAVHGWLNGRVLADRWAVEAFASFYASRVTAQLGGTPSVPSLTGAQRAMALPLNAWPAEAGANGGIESYGFTASAILAEAIAVRAGDESLRRVWVAAADRVAAYQPPVLATTPGAVTETVDGAPDWRGLLDLLSDATGEDFTDLWRTWVVRPAEAELLDARLLSRASFERALAAANGWALPRVIRDALRAWRFDAANDLMSSARTLLAKRAALEAQASAAGLTLPATLRTLFETGSLAAATTEADREAAAITAITTAAASRTADHDLLSNVGMIGEQPEMDLAAAGHELADGHVDASIDASSRAYRAWTGAWSEGRRRLVFLLAALATLAILGPGLWRRAGRRLSLRRPLRA